MKNINRIISVFIVIAILLSVSAVGYANENYSESTYEKAFERLNGLGIITDNINSFKKDENITRAEFTAMIVKMLGMDNLDVGYSVFNDVDRNYWASKYIQIAYSIGIVGGIESNRFEPESYLKYEQAIKMIIKAMQFNMIAEENGGYPSGYLTVANEKNITKYVSAQSDGYISKGSVAILVNNALDVPLLVQTGFNDNVNYEISGTNGTEKQTILSKYLHLEMYKGVVTKVYAEKHIVKINVDSEIKQYDVDSKVDLSGISEVYVTLYVNEEDDIVKYIEVEDEIKVYYDFISSVNEDADVANEYFPNQIDNIYLKNEDEEYSVSDNFIAYFNDEITEHTAAAFIGSFAKVYVQNDEVIKIEAFKLAEGGIIYRADPDVIGYIKGEVNNNIIKGFSNVKDILIYIDGKPYSEMRDLKSDMVFDYWVNENGSKLLIVASSRKVECKLDSYSDDSLVLDNESYGINQNIGIYNYSSAKGRYALNDSLDNLLGNQITAFVDDNKCIRYLKIDDSIESSTSFCGAIMAAGNDGGTLGKPQLKIYKISNGQGEKIYNVVENLHNSPVSFAYAKSVAANLDGKGFFKFTLNKNGEINKIEDVEFWGKSITHNSGFSSSTDEFWIDNLYVKQSTLFAILTVDGEFKVKILDFDRDLYKTSVNSALVITTDYDPEYNSKPNYVMFTGGIDTLHKADEDTRFVKSLSLRDDGRYTLNLYNQYGNQPYVVTSDFVNANKIKKNMLLIFYGGYLGDDPISLKSKIDLSGPTDGWVTDTFKADATSGFYAADGVILRDDDVVQFRVNGVATNVFPLYQWGVVYERISAKTTLFKTGSIRDISSGDKVWFQLLPYNTPRSVGIIIYEKSGMVPN